MTSTDAATRKRNDLTAQAHDYAKRSVPGSVWRASASMVCFVGFALLTICGTLLLPVALLLPGDRSRRVRRLASLGFRMLLFCIQGLTLGKVRVEGRENLSAAAGCLLIANHPSFMDSVVLFALLPEANCIMKAALRRHPLFAPFVHAGGYISNAAGPLQTVAACQRAKDSGETLVIFPEGSRTPAHGVPQLQRGAAHIALRANMDILPATIRCDPPVLTHDRPWYYMPRRRVEYVISFHPPRPPAAFALTDGLEPPHAARALTRALQSWFEHELEDTQFIDADFSSRSQSVVAADTPP